MNYKRKTSQSQFLLILSETQGQKLEKICQKFFKLEAISIMAPRNQTHLLTVSMRYNSYFNNTGKLFLDFYQYTCLFCSSVTVMLKIGEATI